MLRSTSKLKKPSNGKMGAEIQKVYQRPLEKLPVAKDLPRLARMVTIVDAAGKTPKDEQGDDYKPSELFPESPMKDIRRVLCTLVMATEPGTLPGFEHRFDAFNWNIADDGSVSYSKLNEFLSEQVGEDSKVFRIVKTLNQSILAPAASHLMLKIAPRWPYKDVHGGWYCVICVSDPVTVTHRKSEQSVDGSFSFDWVLRLQFNQDATVLQQPTLQIKGLRFAANASDKKREELGQMLREFNTEVNAYL